MIRSRRQFVKSTLGVAGVSVAGGGSMLLSSLVSATETESAGEEKLAEVMASQSAFGPDRVLRLHNVHTDERYEGLYWSQGRFISAGLDQINYLLRDYRLGESLPMDPQVIDFMHSVYVQLETKEPIQILSGYRSAKTNAELAKKSRDVARNSLHIKGQAIDFRVPDTPASKLRKLAVASHRGGVGYYSNSDFIHIDTGPFRAWSKTDG